MKMGTEFWVEHVAAAGLETIPASEYARRHGLSEPALYYWQHKLLGHTQIKTTARYSHLDPGTLLNAADAAANAAGMGRVAVR